MAAVLHLRTAHLARVVVLKRQDSGETKARHYVAYGLKVGQKSILGGFGQSVIGPKRANRVVPQAVPHPYMMHMLGWGQWVRQGSMRGDARVSGEYATKGLVGERIDDFEQSNNTAMLVPNTNTRARCTGDDESAPKTRDSTRRRCNARSRRHVDRRACSRRHPLG